MARPFDRHGQAALVFGACSDLAARFDLAAFRQKPTQLVRLLIIDLFHFLRAERAHARRAGPTVAPAPAFRPFAAPAIPGT